MPWLIPVIALPVALMCAYVPMRVKGKMRAALLLKTSLSVLFILYALYAVLRLPNIGGTGGAPATVNFSALAMGLFTVAGMVCGLLGDVWLDLKDIHLKSQPYYMFSGFSSFLIGHLFYMGGFCAAFSFDWKMLPIAAACGVFLVLFIALTEKPMKLDYGRYRFITLLYSFVIMAALALPVLLALPSVTELAFNDIADSMNRSGMFEIGGLTLRKFPAVFGAGMVSFLLSDLVLSNIYFGTSGKKPKPIMFWLNYILYYGGQFTIAASLYFLEK